MPKDGACYFPGCDSDVLARGLCSGHYQQDRAGKPLAALRRHLTTGEKSEIARLYESGQPLKMIAAVFGRGDMTISAVLRDLGVAVRKPGCTQSGPASPTWRGDDVGIMAAHLRCRQLWGAARGYACIACGERARDWAYDGTDPNQKISAERDSGWRSAYYSAYPEFYMPMCRRCHARRDGELASRELSEYRILKHVTGLSINEIREKLGTVMSNG